MAVAVDQVDRGVSVGGFVGDRLDDLAEAGHRGGIRGGVGQEGGVEHVRLLHEHHGPVVAAPRIGEGLVDLGQDGVRAVFHFGELFRRGSGLAQAGPREQRVVAALDIQDRKRHPVLGETDIFREAQVLLAFHRHGGAEGLAGLVEEHFPDLVQAFQGVVRAVVGAVAVHPFVVAGRVHEGVREGVELGPDVGEVLVGAYGRAVLDIAHVCYKLQVLIGVEVLDVGRELGNF